MITAIAATALLVLCQADYAESALADPPSQATAVQTATVQTETAKTDAQTAKADEVRTILQQGQTSSSMPSGLVVRIGACMGEADKSTTANDKVEELVELWEFTADKVYRVEYESKNGKPSYNRRESRKYDAGTLCQELLDGRAIEIDQQKGTGPQIVLAGTKFGRGSRNITIEWHGRTLLELHETNGPCFVAYRETDARDFGKLYAKLAERARSLFRE